MTSSVTQEQPPGRPAGAPQGVPPEEAGVREEEYLYRDESRLQASSRPVRC